MTAPEPEPGEWQWTHGAVPSVVGPAAEVRTWPVMTYMAGTELDAFEVRARQVGREWRAPSARLLSARQRPWIYPEPEIWRSTSTYHPVMHGGIAAVQMQIDVLLVPGPNGRYVEYEVLPANNPTDQKEG
jgi:hypothetical protein